MRKMADMVTKSDNTDSDKPDGKFKEDAVAGDKTGTEYNRDWPDEAIQPFYSLIRETADLPDGSAEYPGNSQVVSSVRKMINRATALTIAKYPSFSSPANPPTNGTRGLYNSSDIDAVTVMCVGSGTVWYSNDGYQWASTVLPASLDDVAWGGLTGSEVFVVTGGGSIYSSPDGVNWTLRSSPPYTRLDSVIWDPVTAQFVAVGGNAAGPAIAYTSPDGITWTLRTTPVSGSYLDRVVSGVDGIYAKGPQNFLFSADGITWVDRTPSGITVLSGGLAVKNNDVNASSNPSVKRDLIVLVVDQGTKYSVDAGVTWTDFTPVQVQGVGPGSTAVWQYLEYIESCGLFLAQVITVSPPAAVRGLWAFSDPRDTTEQWRRVADIAVTNASSRTTCAFIGGRGGGRLILGDISGDLWYSGELT